MSIYEAFLPVTNDQGLAFDPALFRAAFDELADQFGIVETWPVYQPLKTTAGGLIEQELYRYQLDVPDTDDNASRLVAWREAQEERFSVAKVWMVRYRLPNPSG